MLTRCRVVSGLALVLASALASCGREVPVRLTVIAAAGADPFALGADSVRVRFEGDTTEPMQSRLGTGGAFTFELRPSNPAAAYRVRVEALRGSEVVGVGVTPPVVWNQLGGTTLAVLVQPRDSLVHPPRATLATPRADLRLRAQGQGGVLAVTLANDATADAPVDGYDLLAHATVAYAQAVPREFDGDTDSVPVRGGLLLLRGDAVALYTGSAEPLLRDPAMLTVPEPRRALRAATVVDDTVAGGGWILGGSSSGGPSSRVDYVSSERAFSATPPAPLSTGRRRPEVVALRVATSAQAPRWLVGFGQRSGEGTALELYEPGGTPVALRTGDASIDQRTDATLSCLAVDALGCSIVLVLGGRLADGSLAPDDVVLDGAILRNSSGDASSSVLRRGGFLTRRRFGHRAQWAEGGRVLVAGGSDTRAPVRSIETVDVSAPTTPLPGRLLTEIVAHDPALLSLADGSVFVAGGRDEAGRAVNELWIYRD